ncbi:glycosyltransferase [Helicobacter sp. 23-1044]
MPEAIHKNRKSTTDSPKKRVLITLKDITEGGGGERVGVNLANAFTQNLGYEVQIISFFRTHKTPIYPLDSRISCIYLCYKKAKSKNPLITIFRKSILRIIFCYQTHKIAQQTNADIVLANDGWFIPLFGRKSRDFKPLFVRLWHLSAPKKARRKLRYFDTLIVLSSRELPTWQGYHHNVRVIPNFLPQIPQKSTNHAQKVVLSAGRFSSEKGFLRLIDIWKIVQEMIKSPLPCGGGLGVGKNLQNNADSAFFVLDSANCANFAESNPPPVSPSAREGESMELSSLMEGKDSRDFSDLFQWKLIIVGDGVLKSEIESKIKSLNLQDSIIIKPFTKEIECEYLGASIYAMASHFEGFGMVLAEASSYALPCIAFDIATGPSDIIAHNKSGYLVSDNDLEAYAKHLITLMSDENLRIAFGGEAKRLVGERFSQSVVVQKWGELFEKKS